MKLNVTKCKEMVVDFSKGKRNFPLLVIDNIEVERVNFDFDFDNILTGMSYSARALV